MTILWSQRMGSDRIVFSRKYAPLFRPPDTRYTLVKGGRGSGKSYAVNTSLCDRTYDDAYNTLFTRYTMTSAEISIIPEFTDKLELLHIGNDFKVKSSDITNLATGGKIIFRGLLTSSGNQVAKLKSIHNVKRWILDEAQELVDENLFDTIDFSIREKDAANNLTMVFNAPDIHHWLYRRFYTGIPEGFNGVADGVRYIDTTYLDNLPNLDASFIAQAEKMKAVDYEKYCNVFLGHWASLSEGIIYRDWKEIPETDYPRDLPVWYGVDWGYANDPTAVIRLCFDPGSKTVYAYEVCYRRGLLIGDIGHIIRQDIIACGASTDTFIYCDPARPEHIAELRTNYDLMAVPAVNRNKTGRIEYLKYFNVRYCGADIRQEVETYSWRQDPKDASHYLNEPMDGNDHAMDAINYGAVTHLRWLGVTNRIGEE